MNVMATQVMRKAIAASMLMGLGSYTGPAQAHMHTAAAGTQQQAAHGTASHQAHTAHAGAKWVEPGDETPAHFDGTPHPAGPPILSGAKLSGSYFTRPFQAVIYQMAALVAPVLYQQPCYCRCDRAIRHKSLHTCFEGLHGAACGTCMREAMYAYQQTHQGKTPAEIRAGIERGEWQQLHLEDAAL